VITNNKHLIPQLKKSIPGRFLLTEAVIVDKPESKKENPNDLGMGGMF